ncbi:hypothetical protein DIPPA_28052 [Diplonema papillatum]|nr:hypothetical protein DIPPA_28052 [Diplonema papillatum]
MCVVTQILAHLGAIFLLAVLTFKQWWSRQKCHSYVIAHGRGKSNRGRRQRNSEKVPPKRPDRSAPNQSSVPLLDPLRERTGEPASRALVVHSDFSTNRCFSSLGVKGLRWSLPSASATCGIKQAVTSSVEPTAPATSLMLQQICRLSAPPRKLLGGKSPTSSIGASADNSTGVKGPASWQLVVFNREAGAQDCSRFSDKPRAAVACQAEGEAGEGAGSAEKGRDSRAHEKDRAADSEPTRDRGSGDQAGQPRKDGDEGGDDEDRDKHPRKDGAATDELEQATDADDENEEDKNSEDNVETCSDTDAHRQAAGNNGPEKATDADETAEKEDEMNTHAQVATATPGKGPAKSPDDNGEHPCEELSAEDVSGKTGSRSNDEDTARHPHGEAGPQKATEDGSEGADRSDIGKELAVAVGDVSHESEDTAAVKDAVAKHPLAVAVGDVPPESEHTAAVKDAVAKHPREELAFAVDDVSPESEHTAADKHAVAKHPCELHGGPQKATNNDEEGAHGRNSREEIGTKDLPEKRVGNELPREDEDTAADGSRETEDQGHNAIVGSADDPQASAGEAAEMGTDAVVEPGNGRHPCAEVAVGDVSEESGDESTLERDENTVERVDENTLKGADESNLERVDENTLERADGNGCKHAEAAAKMEAADEGVARDHEDGPRADQAPDAAEARPDAGDPRGTQPSDQCSGREVPAPDSLAEPPARIIPNRHADSEAEAATASEAPQKNASELDAIGSGERSGSKVPPPDSLAEQPAEAISGRQSDSEANHASEAPESNVTERDVTASDECSASGIRSASLAEPPAGSPISTGQQAGPEAEADDASEMPATTSLGEEPEAVAGVARCDRPAALEGCPDQPATGTKGDDANASSPPSEADPSELPATTSAGEELAVVSGVARCDSPAALERNSDQPATGTDSDDANASSLPSDAGQPLGGSGDSLAESRADRFDEVGLGATYDACLDEERERNAIQVEEREDRCNAALIGFLTLASAAQDVAVAREETDTPAGPFKAGYRIEFPSFGSLDERSTTYSPSNPSQQSTVPLKSGDAFDGVPKTLTDNFLGDLDTRARESWASFASFDEVFASFEDRAVARSPNTSNRHLKSPTPKPAKKYSKASLLLIRRCLRRWKARVRSKKLQGSLAVSSPVSPLVSSTLSTHSIPPRRLFQDPLASSDVGSGAKNHPAPSHTTRSPLGSTPPVNSPCPSNEEPADTSPSPPPYQATCPGLGGQPGEQPACREARGVPGEHAAEGGARAGSGDEGKRSCGASSQSSGLIEPTPASAHRQADEAGGAEEPGTPPGARDAAHELIEPEPSRTDRRRDVGKAPEDEDGNGSQSAGGSVRAVRVASDPLDAGASPVEKKCEGKPGGKEVLFRPVAAGRAKSSNKPPKRPAHYGLPRPTPYESFYPAVGPVPSTASLDGLFKQPSVDSWRGDSREQQTGRPSIPVVSPWVHGSSATLDSVGASPPASEAATPKGGGRRTWGLKELSRYAGMPSMPRTDTFTSVFSPSERDDFAVFAHGGLERADESWSSSPRGHQGHNPASDNSPFLVQQPTAPSVASRAQDNDDFVVLPSRSSEDEFVVVPEQ